MENKRGTDFSVPQKEHFRCARFMRLPNIRFEPSFYIFIFCYYLYCALGID